MESNIIKTGKKQHIQSIINNSLSLSEFVWISEIQREDIATPEKKAGFEKRIKTLKL